MKDEIINFQFFALDYVRHVRDAMLGMDTTKMWLAVNAIQDCKGTVWLVGNGGSAALASHMATDLQLAGVRAQALTDVAAITTYGNDHGFDYVFEDQLKRLVFPSDVLIAISGSGNSINTIFPAMNLRPKGVKVIAITGFTGGRLQLNCDIHLHVPISHMGIAQDGHQIILHIICYYLMEKLKNEKTTRTSSTTRPAVIGPDTVLRSLDRWLDGKHDNLGTGVL